MAMMITAATREAVKAEILKWLRWNAGRHDTDAAIATAKRDKAASGYVASTLRGLADELDAVPIVDPDAPIGVFRGEADPTLSVRLDKTTHAQVKTLAERQGIGPRTFARNAIRTAVDTAQRQTTVDD